MIQLQNSFQQVQEIETGCLKYKTSDTGEFRMSYYLKQLHIPERD